MDVVMKVAFVLQGNCRKVLAEWMGRNWRLLLSHKLIFTGTTGRWVEESVTKHRPKGQMMT